MTRSFGLDAPEALRLLQSATERFRGDGLNKDLARECALKAWHLHEHAFKALGPNAPFANLREFRDHVISACPEVDYLRNICTDTKHTEVRKATIVAARYSGAFCGDDFSSADFDIARLEIKVDDNQTFMFKDLLERVVAYWSEFFDNMRIE